MHLCESGQTDGKIDVYLLADLIKHGSLRHAYGFTHTHASLYLLAVSTIHLSGVQNDVLQQLYIQRNSQPQDYLLDEMIELMLQIYKQQYNYSSLYSRIKYVG